MQALPDPLLTTEGSEKLVQAAANNCAAQRFQDIVDSLPKIHLHLFCLVLDFLRQLIQNESVTLVNSVVLSCIFGPILISETRDLSFASTMSFAVLQGNDKLKATALLVLLNYYEIPSSFFQEEKEKMNQSNSIPNLIHQSLEMERDLEEISSVSSATEDPSSSPIGSPLPERLEFSKELIAPKIQDPKKIQILHVTSSNLRLTWTNKETKSMSYHLLILFTFYFIFFTEKMSLDWSYIISVSKKEELPWASIIISCLVKNNSKCEITEFTFLCSSISDMNQVYQKFQKKLSLPDNRKFLILIDKSKNKKKIEKEWEKVFPLFASRNIKTTIIGIYIFFY